MIVSGAAPLPPELATAVMDEFGEILYNGYASTEVGPGTLATPKDLRAAPGTVGKPAPGVKIKILDEEGLELPTGQTGRIFVGNPMLFEGYTGGGTKQVIDGLMSTGDVGHFDEAGRLFVDGRDDDMILSGGENVFPQEVEELLAGHDAVADAAVFGVPDKDFGQRLAAFVVLKPGASATEEELQAYVRERLARYKIPREIAFVEQLPGRRPASFSAASSRSCTNRKRRRIDVEPPDLAGIEGRRRAGRASLLAHVPLAAAGRGSRAPRDADHGRVRIRRDHAPDGRVAGAHGISPQAGRHRLQRRLLGG